LKGLLRNGGRGRRKKRYIYAYLDVIFGCVEVLIIITIVIILHV
jgi:hypothetical protein